MKTSKKRRLRPASSGLKSRRNDLKRAKKFYSSLFGWKIKAFPGMAEYLHIDTGGANDSPMAA